MKSGSLAWIQMKKQLKKGLETDEQVYSGKIYRYDAKNEQVFVSVSADALPKLSLDAIYECRIQDGEDGLLCTGRIRERFHGEGQHIVKFEIENGFYKICLNSVDK